MGKQKIKKKSAQSKIGLTQKICLQFSIIVTVAVVILAAISVTYSKKMMASSALEMMQTMTIQSSELVSSEMQRYIDIGESLANSRLLDEEVDIEDRIAELKSNAEFYGHIAIGIGDLDGEFTFSDGTTANLAEKEFFKDVTEKEESVVGEPHYSEFLDQTIFTYAIPVRCVNDGDIESIIVFDRPGDQISSITNKISFLETGSAFVIDEEGNVIADKNQDAVNSHVSLLDVSAGNTSESLSQIVKKMIAGEQGVGEYTLNGEKKAVSYAPVGDTGWSIGISIEYSDLLDEANDMRNVIIIVGVIILLVTVLVSIKSAKDLTGDLNTISENIKQIGNYDFTVEIDEKILNRSDEIGVIASASNELKNSVGNMILQIKNVGNDINNNSSEILEFSEELSASTSDISSSISEVSQGNSKQSEEVTDIALETEEATRRIEALYENTNVVQINTLKIEENAMKSKSIVDGMENLINKFGNEFKSFRENVDELGSDMNTINSITNIINGISEQTNLLALNAAIEAARAGEMGKGFAVVADEIRILAEQSKQNSEEITRIIVKSSNNTKSIVEQTREINNALVEQNKQVKEVKEAFDDIAVSVENVIPELNNVQKEFDFVQKGQKGISGNIENLSAVSEQVAASSEEILASSEELNEASGDLTGLAEKLNSSVDVIMDELNKFKI